MDWDEEVIKLYLDDELLNEIPLKDTVNGSIGKRTNPFYETAISFVEFGYWWYQWWSD